MLQTALLLLGLIVSPWGPEVDEETRLIAGLRDRRLFDLAEQHCHRMKVRPNLTPTESATFSIELIKTKTAKAILADGTAREPAWQAIHQTAEELFRKHHDHPRLILIKVQAVLAHVARGQLLRQELAAEMATEGDREIALNELQLANSQFNELQREIQKLIPQQRNRSLTEHELTSEELLKLNNQVRLQLAITNINRAQLFGTDDRLNRIDVLGSVLERSREVQRETVPQQPAWWEANALQIECYRLLKKFNEAQTFTQTVHEIAAEQTNLLEDRWIEQQLLLALDLADEQGSIKYLQAAEKLANRSPPLELARLSTAVDFSLRAIPPGKAEWLNRAAQLARNIEAQHGSYWGRRAKLVLITGGNEATANRDPTHLPDTMPEASSAELDLMIGLAEQAERQGRFDDAVKAYDRASTTALQLDARPQSFSLAVKAGQALEKQNRNFEAANRFIALANQNREYTLASAAHLRGCWNWGRLLNVGAQSQAGNANIAALNGVDVRARFLELLQEHLKYWPQADTANQVRVWLGGQLQSSANSPEHWQQTFETYVGVVPHSNLFSTAILQAGYSARQWINGTEKSQQSIVAAQAFQRLKSITDACLADTASQQQALLVTTEIGIRYGTTEPKTLIQPLSTLLTSAPKDDPLSRQAAAWLYAIQAFETDLESELTRLLNLISVDKKWLAIADQGIAAIKTRNQASTTQGVGKARAALTETALNKFGDQMEAAERIAWRYRNADALIDAEQEDEALIVLSRLEQDLPNDAGIKLRIARLLTLQSSDPTQPLLKWRQLASQLKPQSEGWFEAKYNVAVLLDKAGETEEARKMLEYMQAIPPGWENSHLRDDFNKLLHRLR